MKRKMLAANTASLILFGMTDLVLLSVPLLTGQETLPQIAYVLAALFWGGMLGGLLLQAYAGKLQRKLAPAAAASTLLKKRMLPIILVLGVILVLILLLWKKSVVLFSIDLALLLFSIELYFFLKRRYSV